MRIIREVREDELAEFGRITVEAFPGMKVDTPEAHERMLGRLAAMRTELIVHYLGVYEAERMVGVMRFYDFTMKVRGVRTLVGGVGGVAVDLRRKKSHVAADMIRYFLDYYRQKGAGLVALYPFRPDFYHRMGFGHGVKMNRYSFRPDALPDAGRGVAVDFLGQADREEIAACYERYMERTNGLIAMPPYLLDALLNDTAGRIVGYREDGRLRGYAVFRFEPAPGDNWLANNILLRALIYDDTAALMALLGFLRKQSDQVDRIIYDTQDETFHYLLSDPRDGSNKLLAGLWHQTNTQGIGIMYRVVDVAALFGVLREHDFGGVNVRVRFNLTDTFLPENGVSHLVVFNDGRAAVVGKGAADVEVTLDVADFSSLVVGAVDFRRLHEYGRVAVSDLAYVPILNRLFYTDQRPWCLTHF